MSARASVAVCLVCLLAACAAPQNALPDPPLVATSAPLALVIDRLPDDFPHGGEAREAADIDLIVIHSIGGPICRDGQIWFTPANGDAAFWRDWFLDQAGKSIHYVVGRGGDIAQQRPELRTAGHVSFGGIMIEVNRRSIGIELVNRGDGIEPFPQALLERFDPNESRLGIPVPLEV